MTKKALLAIDGGGIRGIIPLCALVEMERQINKPAREVFSFLAGTSTGAIIIAALSQGMPAAQVLDMYVKIGPQAFRFDLLHFLGSLASYKYRSAGLAEIMQPYLGVAPLNALPVDIMITATRVSDGKAYYFVRDNEANSQTTGNLRLLDCVVASAAAPTYFDPWNVPTIGPCVDGGVGVAGNPVYQMCTEAFYYTAPGRYAPENSVIISLGTGYVTAMAAPHNMVDWVKFVIGELLESPAEQQTQITQRHFGERGAVVYRFNPQMPRDIGMDNVKAIPELVQIGKVLAQGLNWADMLAGVTADLRVPPRPQSRNLR
ncbi:MAG: patatin-like phospholipase family protein [Thermoflexales bacterium]|nr:patatin-like phospholipase family protein [Thermoflexales bacterium]